MIFGCYSLLNSQSNDDLSSCLSHCKSDRPATHIEYEKEIATDEISIRIWSGELSDINVGENSESGLGFDPRQLLR